VTEADVLTAIREHLEDLFPKVCPNCERRFATLRNYLMETTPLGQAIPYDAERGDWRPLKALGTIAYYVCPCGTTMALSSDGMPLERLWSLMDWARTECERRAVSPRQLLNQLRDVLCKQVLAEPEGSES
jgi:hypothetical protein